jgi:hypothetical protein
MTKTSEYVKEEERTKAAVSILPGWKNPMSLKSWSPKRHTPQLKHLIAEAEYRGLVKPLRKDRQVYMDYLCTHERPEKSLALIQETPSPGETSV